MFCFCQATHACVLLLKHKHARTLLKQEDAICYSNSYKLEPEQLTLIVPLNEYFFSRVINPPLEEYVLSFVFVSPSLSDQNLYAYKCTLQD